MRSFLKNSSLQLKIGIFLLILCFFIGFVLPLFGESNPEEWNTYIINLKPSAEHILGTNALGQDIFLLLAKSIGNSLFIGIIVAFISTIIGVFMGMLAAFKGGFADRVITLFADTFIVIPSLPIMILLASLLKGRTPILDLIILLVIFSWSWSSRAVRSLVLSLRERDFIDTARFSGESLIKILVKECLPFILSYAVASFFNGILAAIRIESSLSVIGMTNNGQATLGTMIYWANNYQSMMLGNWIWIGAPVLAIVVIFVALFMTLSGAQRYTALKRGK